MAQFDLPYHKYILPNEGGYANVAGDKGGETYMGIARNLFPNWEGWTFIDFQKKTSGPIKNNKTFPDIQYLVDAFYLNMWDAHNFGKINSQDVANVLFDFYVNSGGIAIKKIQGLVGVAQDGVLGSQSIDAINKANASKLNNDLLALRKTFYESIVQRDPTQGKFLNGWLARIAKFPVLKTTGIIGIVVVAGLLVYLLVSTPTKQKSGPGVVHSVV